MTDEAIALLAPRIGTRAACAAAGVPQATWYRRHRTSPVPLRPALVPQRDRVQPRALAAAERQAILDALHSERFADTAPAEAWATLLDEGIYLGSVFTYYRVLRQAGESRERRAQAAHPATVKPELAATGPNQVYSWDITKLHGPAKWTYYHLYVILDISATAAAAMTTLIVSTGENPNMTRMMTNTRMRPRTHVVLGSTAQAATAPLKADICVPLLARWSGRCFVLRPASASPGCPSLGVTGDALSIMPS